MRSVYGKDAEGRVCTRCGEYKLRDSFYRKKTLKSGMCSCCIECVIKFRKSPEISKIISGYHRKRLLEKGEWIRKARRLWTNTPRGRLKSYKDNAKKGGHVWALSDEEFLSFWEKPCHYCGGGIKTIGLDRVENSKGYILENVVPCCSVCNRMKSDCVISTFLSHIKAIYERNFPCEKSTEISSTLQKRESLMLFCKDVIVSAA